MTSVVGVPPAGALAEQASARSDGAAAAVDEARARGELEQARDDLARAKVAGRRAEEDAREVARAVAAAFAAAGGSLPAASAPGGAPTGEGGDLAGLLRLLGTPAAGITAHVLTNALELAAQRLSTAARKVVPPRRVGGKWIDGYWRRKPRGGRTWVRGHYRGGQIVSGATRATNASRRWGKARKYGGRAGGVLGFALPAAGQVGEDLHEKDLSTTDKVGRAAGAGAYGGALSLGGAAAGAAAGAAIGSAVPIVGTTAGAVVGGIIGSGAMGTVADMTKGPAVATGQKAANLAVDGAEGLAKGAKSVADKLNPF